MKTEAFHGACRFARITVAKWLWSLRGVDLHHCKDFTFRWVGTGMDVKRWLVSLDPEWPWPASIKPDLMQWSRPRHAWMCNVAHSC